MQITFNYVSLIVPCSSASLTGELARSLVKMYLLET